MNKTTKKIALVGILTALYVVCSAFIKIPFIGNISLDLGYIVFAIALSVLGYWGIFVGVVGCAFESILFSAYGFSISWVVANAVIGLLTAFTFQNTKNFWIRFAMIVASCALGLIICKTLIECSLYSIPLLVKLPKAVTAFAVDATVMTIGLLIEPKVTKLLK